LRSEIERRSPAGRCSRRRRSRRLGLVAFLALVGVASTAGAADPRPAPPPAAAPAPALAPAATAPTEPAQARVKPDEVSGVEREERPAGAASRYAWNALLWVPRSTIDLVFLTTGVAGGLLENEQIVPRTRDLFFSSSGKFGIFPTFFMETGISANVGARMIARADHVATTLRGGYGGPDSNVVEGRAHVLMTVPVPTVLTITGFHDRRTDRGFLGVGQTPETDPRNHFLSDNRVGIYRERRERAILSLGVRPVTDLEIFVSGSFTQRRVDNPPDAGAVALTNVFAPESIVGAYQTTQIVYAEGAVRYDSRANRAGEAGGVHFEVYAGREHRLAGDHIDFSRYGARAGAFIPFIRPTTILSPMIGLDTMTSAGDAVVPFTELVGQPMFRGFNTRRDYVSLVGNLDYRWYVSRFIAGRLFVDAAHVYPTLKEFRLDHLRWAAGFGIDLHSSTTQIGRVAFALSPDGFNFLFTFGVPAGFGDRQHRD
jgi:hypothetical protein